MACAPAPPARIAAEEEEEEEAEEGFTLSWSPVGLGVGRELVTTSSTYYY